MPQASIQCPHCRTVHPVAALPPAGTWLRCNACGNAFATGQVAPQQGAPLPGFGTPAGNVQHNPFAQRPASANYDPFAQSMARPQQPSASAASGGGWELWQIAAIAGGGFGVLMVLVIVVMSMMRSSGSSPPVAANPPGSPAVAASPATGAPATAVPTVIPTATAATPVLPTVATTTPPAGFPPAMPMAVPLSSTPSSPFGSGSRPATHPISQLKGVQSKAEYQYTWKSGEKYRYGFEVQNEASGSVGPGGKLGTVEYVVGALPGAGGVGSAADEGQKASGTAFVIHEDGLLLTCHHVVAGSTTLKVSLAGKDYKADVVAIDEPNDLAIIRIDATGLQPLPLGDSNQVQLAEDLKAVGFPLSDVLGRSVKITSGSLAGRVENGGKKLLQVDIAINPGNSGGPLVNMHGEVVGVNSSGLFGSKIQEVAFAVPSNLGKDLVSKINITIPPRSRGALLDGVNLARLVTKSTAFVEVELGSENAAMLEFTGRSKSKGSVTTPPQQISSRVVAGVNGEVLGAQEDLPLGFGLGTFGTMIFEKLPEEGQKTWEERKITPFSVSGGSEGGRQVVSLIIEEHTKYEIKSIDEKQIVVAKHVKVGTVGQASTATMQVTGEGTWTFDRRAGVPISMQMSVESNSYLNGKVTHSRGTVRYERLSDSGPSA